MSAEALERVHYFSNGMEGRWWQSAWCDRCLHDHQFRLGRGTGCPIFGAMLLASSGDGPPPGEIIENDPDGVPPLWFTCVEFKPYGYRRPGPSTPRPVPPGQGLLPFDAPTGERQITTSPYQSETDLVLAVVPSEEGK